MSEQKSTEPRRGRPPKLDAERIVDAALRTLDADGPAAVSIRRVGADLGVSHMTLYGYFASKDDLLEAMVARTLAVPGLEPRPDAAWDEDVADAIRAIRAALLDRPGIADLLVTRDFSGPWVGAVRERLLALVEPAGLGEATAVDAISILFNYMLGTVLVESSRGLGGSAQSFELGLELLVSGLRERAAVRD